MISDTLASSFEEAFNLLCGEKLGGGIARMVFECAIDPTLVVKVERDPGSFQNVLEWRHWDECRFYQPAADWMAPCVKISARGMILLQKRVHPAQRHELPAKLPDFLTDIKPEHFGFYDGRLVCCDYALMNTRLPITPKAADWD